MITEPARVCALTGATGYLGSTIRKKLESVDWRVICLTRQKPAPPGQIHWTLNHQTEIADNLSRFGVTALIHAAWDFNQTREQEARRVNVSGSLKLLDECCKAGIEQRIFISTISAFPGARSLYGQTKLAVEQAFAAQKATILRPGLIYGQSPGGMFGSLRKQVRGSMVVPLIGDGSYPQYLVHADDLALVIERLLQRKETSASPLTIAHPTPVTFRQLLVRIAKSEGSHPVFLQIPWRIIYGGLKLFEVLGLQLSFRSDSVISLIFQNSYPQISDVTDLGVSVRPFN